MSATIFFVLLAVYALSALKVEEWTTIYLLGFKIETPRYFLQHPRAYLVTRKLLFAATAIAAFFVTDLAWYFGLAALIVAGLLAGLIGRKKAYGTFRRLHNYLAEEETDSKELAELRAGAQLTDSELRARVVLAKKYAV